MKRLFLTSQVQHVADKIAETLGDEVKLKAVFIDTTIRDQVHSNLDWHKLNKSKMEESGFVFDMYDIAGKSAEQIVLDLDKYDIMYIEGGNPFYLQQEAQKNNFIEFVKRKVEEGLIYIGTSAGSILAGPDTSSVNRPGKSADMYNLASTKGLNLVNFVVMPHWGDVKKKDYCFEYKIPNSYNENYPYIMLTDTQYVEVKDDSFKIIDVKNNNSNSSNI